MSAEEEWKALLSGAYAGQSAKSPLRFIPSNPRCKLCRAPFRAPGGALQAAEDLLRATGHGDDQGPWAPLGAAVHTGTAFVGIVGSRGSSDFTALGDPMNLTAHLASQAAVGEILVTEAAMRSAVR